MKINPPSLPAPPHIIARLRRKQRTKKRSSPLARLGRIATGAGMLVGVIGAVLLLAAGLAYASVTRDLPVVGQLERLLDPTSGYLVEPTRIYDRSGKHLLATLASVDAPRTLLRYDQISPHLVLASLALTQPDFWESPGFTTQGWQDSATHPTLAQALVSDLLLADESPGTRRALRERLLAARVTSDYGREQVIAWILNSTHYGQLAYGVEAASRLYLGKSAGDLSLSEACLLAATGRTPALNPHEAPQAAEANRLDAIATLLLLGWITPQEARAAAAEVPVILPAQKPTEETVSRQFIDLMLRQLDAAFGAGRVERGGLSIYSSIDLELQNQAECALQVQLGRLAGTLPATSPGDDPACTAASLLPPLDLETAFADLHAGVLVVDPLNGQVLAAVGDLSRQPAGTIITPFIYLAGFSRGLSPGSLGWDIPAESPMLGQVYQGPMRLRIALANDYLPPTGSIVDRMGIGSILSTAGSFGLAFPSTGLLQEDFDLSPFDLASAFSILAREGIQFGQDPSLWGVEPAGEALPLELTSVLQLRHADGSLWMDLSEPESRLVATPQLTYLLTHVLGDQGARLSAPGSLDPLEVGRPAAVKSGRSLDERLAWTAGYTPRRSVVVFIDGAAASGRAATDGLWGAVMQAASRDLPAEGWQMPSGILPLKVCDPSGLLPTAACPNVVEEIFLEGSQPVQSDSLYQVFEINTETGLLATVFTPPELVERRVFMVVPPEALPWAEAVGLELPPSSYDHYLTPTTLADVHITSPLMFADGRGVMEISGSAAGEDFVSYRLEYGQGLNPLYWNLLGADATSPVTEDLLGTWDTTSLPDGLYTLRLMVVRSENRLEEALVQVTLDNTPPQVLIHYPADGAALDVDEDPWIVFQAQVEEAYLTEVTFSVDGVEIGRRQATPFWAVWSALPGEHSLQVTALDRAGNVGEAEIQFNVRR